MTLYSDAPIASTAFDALGRAPVAERLVTLVMETPQQPLVLGLIGGAGTGKTSILRMTGELCAERADLRAFAIDCWIAGDVAKVNEAFLSEVSQLFEAERVVGSTEKVREKLFAVGDYVSAVARFAGAKIDVRGGLERTPDSLRTEVMKHTEAIGKRIVVFLDHLDRMPPADAVGVLKSIARWGTFPYFAFVVAIDRALVAHKLQTIDGNTDDLERVISVELPVPPVDRVALAATVRGGLTDLAKTRGVDPAPALALFEVEGGIGFAAIATPRNAKRFLNALVATLLAEGVELRTACVVELIRELAPDVHAAVAARFPFTDDRARLAAELATGQSAAVAALLAALV